jgi:hypothetical protein
MSTVDLGRYRRFVQMLWDPEPTNDVTTDLPVWCLGNSYTLDGRFARNNVAKASDAVAESFTTLPSDSNLQLTATAKPPETPPDSISSSFSSSLAYDEPDAGGGWPSAFLDDFESRIWMTYRSDFEVIPKSDDPRAISALSLTMRIKTQFVDQNGFTSDTGWGCMIRSGQSLLANAMASLRLGRGSPDPSLFSSYIRTNHSQIGEGQCFHARSGNSSHSSQMIQEHHIQYIVSFYTGLMPVENIPGSGLALLQLPDVSSMYTCRSFRRELMI